MPAPQRSLQIALAVAIAVHLVAAWVAPGALWGMSHLAAWPPVVAFAWTAVALAALVLAPRWTRAGAPRFPGVRGALLWALGFGVVAFLLRERSHFFGDGQLIARSLVHGPVTYWRAPLLVRPATWMAISAEQHLGWSAETTFTVLTVTAGVATVFAALRLIAVLTPRPEARALFAVLLATSGAIQVFFGHVEFYAGLALALVLWTWLAVEILAARRPIWPTWFATALMPALHLSATCLLPAQLVVAWSGWHRRERWTPMFAAVTAIVLALAVLYAFGRDPKRGAQPAAARILGAYFDRDDIRHAFSLWSPAHALAVVNQILLVAPLALVAVILYLAHRRPRVAAPVDSTVAGFLAAAAIGALALDVVFGRELGPCRDWDTLAPYALFYLLGAGMLLLRAGFEARGGAILVLIAGLHHTAPWIALQCSPERTVRYLHLVLAHPTQWSPYARGYLHEEIAIAHRDAGDLDKARGEFAAAIAANPSDARYRVSFGDMARQLGDIEAAIASYRAALERRPDFGPALNNLAYTLMLANRDLDQARAHAQRATRGDPSNLNYHLTLGFVELQLWDLAAARRALDAARSLAPDSPKVQSLADAIAQRETTVRDLPAP
jgi:tetratricopeptide (TPR) repeat protein